MKIKKLIKEREKFLLKNKTEIENWLNNNNIKKYIIHDNFDVSVIENNITIRDNTIEFLPINFVGKIKYFSIYMTKLKILTGCPEEVDVFRCTHCHELSTLEGCPKKVKYFSISNCNNLSSLFGMPGKFEEFNCSHCYNLKKISLKFPKEFSELVLDHTNKKLEKFVNELITLLYIRNNGRFFRKDDLLFDLIKKNSKFLEQ